MPDENLRNLAEEYWETLLEASPSTATLLGDHRYDDRLEDLSAEAEQTLRVRWQSLRDRLDEVPREGLDVGDLVTHGLLAAELDDAIASIDQRLIELQSDQMTGFHVELLQAVPLGHKLSLTDLTAGDEVIEYGLRVGIASKDIKRGEYVHVHNVRSARWQHSVA